MIFMSIFIPPINNIINSIFDIHLFLFGGSDPKKYPRTDAKALKTCCFALLLKKKLLGYRLFSSGDFMYTSFLSFAFE